MLTVKKKAQFYTMAVAIIAVVLITTSIIIVGIRNSIQNIEVSEDIYFVFDNIKRETLERVELILANLTQMDKNEVSFDYREITRYYLDTWINCLRSEYENRGFKIHLSYNLSQIVYVKNWNKSISESSIKVNLSIQIENEEVKIEQVINATHTFKLYISRVEQIGTSFFVEVNFTKIIGNLNEIGVDYATVYINGTAANYVGGGVYEAKLTYTGSGTVTIYVTATAPSGVFVEALTTK